MNRAILLFALVAIAVPGVSALSQEAPAARFLLTPGKDAGFTRLDTKTGAVSHCGQLDGVWSCEPFDDSDLQDHLSALSADVARLSAEVDRLSARIDALGPAPEAVAVQQPDQSDDEQPGFADAVLRRFLDLVREIKRDPSSRT